MQISTHKNLNTSNNSNRSFSGTWDPSSASGNFEEITWDEYRPDDFFDNHNNYS